MKIKNTLDKGVGKHINALVYGKSGVGKTMALGTLPNKEGVIVVSLEQGLMSIRDSGIDYVEVGSFNEFVEVINELAETDKYHTIAVDSLTELQQRCMQMLTGETDSTDLNQYVQPQIKDWGALKNIMTRTVKSLRDMSKNIICNCLSEVKVDEVTLKQVIAPQLQGTLKDTIPAYFDLVLYAFSQEKKNDTGGMSTTYAFQTRGNNELVAKDRSGNLDKFERPEYAAIFEKVYGSNN